jgi:4-diphosphocytidyl-2-C-methyl-D-erythritol kinase
MDTAGSSITIEARAKINLTLEILGVRPDGYHELRSIVMPVSLCDTVTLARSYAGVALAVSLGPGVDASRLGPVDRNLAVRAAVLLQRRYGVDEGVRIRIHKRIPIGGGMGGGSADAAGVLRGLNALWGLGLGTGELEALGAELGSDVPALVHGGAVLMEGRGERVSGLFGGGGDGPREGFWVVIANPGVMCSTPEVFKRWRAGLTNGAGILHNMCSFIRACQVDGAAGALYNGLEPAVFEGYPAVARAARLLREAGCLGVCLSGSGASVFGLVRDEAHGEEVGRRLGAGLWHVLARTCPMV